jgi:hypothetical protein
VHCVVGFTGIKSDGKEPILKQRAAYPFPDERALLMNVKKTPRTSSGAGNQFWSREPIIETENQLLEQEPVLRTAS